MPTSFARTESTACLENGQLFRRSILDDSALRLPILIFSVDNNLMKEIMFGSVFYPSEHLAKSHVLKKCSINICYL